MSWIYNLFQNLKTVLENIIVQSFIKILKGFFWTLCIKYIDTISRMQQKKRTKIKKKKINKYQPIQTKTNKIYIIKVNRTYKNKTFGGFNN